MSPHDPLRRQVELRKRQNNPAQRNERRESVDHPMQPQPPLGGFGSRERLVFRFKLRWLVPFLRGEEPLASTQQDSNGYKKNPCHEVKRTVHVDIGLLSLVDKVGDVIRVPAQ